MFISCYSISVFATLLTQNGGEGNPTGELGVKQHLASALLQQQCCCLVEK
jgi:hypothetical protein